MTTPKPLPSLDRIKQLFEYDPITGVFLWKINRGGMLAGSIAGYLDGKGQRAYYRIALDGVGYPAHRIAWFYFYGEEPLGEIDHINRIKTDNRIENLRVVTGSANCTNVGLRRNNKSGIIGVTYCPSQFTTQNKWAANFSKDKIKYYVGLFKTKEEAAIALEQARLELNKKEEFHLERQFIREISLKLRTRRSRDEEDCSSLYEFIINKDQLS